MMQWLKGFTYVNHEIIEVSSPDYAANFTHKTKSTVFKDNKASRIVRVRSLIPLYKCIFIKLDSNSFYIGKLQTSITYVL